MVEPSPSSVIDQMIRQVELSDISSIRAVLGQIMEVATAPNSSAFDLKEAIETDPPLASRVLKRVNSAFYGIARKGSGISDIHLAVVFIGFETVKELAMSQSICPLFKNDQVVHGYSRVALWEHCVATAMTGRLLYRREYQLPGGQIHAAGLLHDIGLIVEDQCAQESFHRALRALAADPGPGLAHHERAVFGFTHAEVGQALAARWNFPTALVQAIGTEEMPPGECDSEGNLLSATVLLASRAVQLRRIGYVESPALEESTLDEPLKRLGVSRTGLDLILDEVERDMGKLRDEGWF